MSNIETIDLSLRLLKQENRLIIKEIVPKADAIGH